MAGLKDDASAKNEGVNWRMERGTDGALMASVYGGADIIRVHDVGQGKALARIGDAIWRRHDL